MFKLNKRHIARSLALGMVLAVVGFCYATSTADQRSASASDSAGGRGVGSNTLHFTNALLLPPVALPALNTYDLGDACFGS